MSIEIISFTLGPVATNCYIIGSTESRAAVVIDPVDDAQYLFEGVHQAGWTVQLILATHGHYDHVMACRELKDLTDAPFYIHHKTPQVNDASDSFVSQLFPPIPQPDRLLTNESESIEVDDISFQTLYTPGHAPDHVCFFMPEHEILFGGDCLFAGSIGRTDLPYASYDLLMTSIFDRMLPLGDSIHVLPGHMQSTTIGRERLTNPFLLDYTYSHRRPR